MVELQIYNSLSQKLEKFVPQQANRVKMYVCGMTVYDHCHIGHGRIMVWFDVVLRYLRSLGFNVQYIRNITDIDDKIINRAYELGEGVDSLTNRYIELMHQDERNLGVIAPDHEPRVTQHIPAIIQMIEQLLAEGYAYQGSSGDIYYRVGQFASYGKLAHQDLASLQSGIRVEVDAAKENPLDFVLWKSAKEGEPYWDAPWGAGRPGWHIECSAMARHYLGDTVDIHGGGADLLFPHHQNEIAQSEAVTGQPLANYWMHVGYVQRQSEKMSKSLHNFVLISDVLEHYNAEVLRFQMLSSHYRSALNFSEEGLLQAESGLRRLYLALRCLERFENGQIEIVGADGDANFVLENEESWQRLMADPDLGGYISAFQVAMADDFNTPQALAALFEMAKQLNQCTAKKESALMIKLAKGERALGSLLGILQQQPTAFLHSGVDQELVRERIKKRSQARQNSNWEVADSIRDELKALGIELEDEPDGSTEWFYMGGSKWQAE